MAAAAAATDASPFVAHYGPFTEFRSHFRCLACQKHNRACLVRSAGSDALGAPAVPSTATCLACHDARTACRVRRVLMLDMPLGFCDWAVAAHGDALTRVARLTVSDAEPHVRFVAEGEEMEEEVEFVGDRRGEPSVIDLTGSRAASVGSTVTMTTESAEAEMDGEADTTAGGMGWARARQLSDGTLWLVQPLGDESNAGTLGDGPVGAIGGNIVQGAAEGGTETRAEASDMGEHRLGDMLQFLRQEHTKP